MPGQTSRKELPIPLYAGSPGIAGDDGGGGGDGGGGDQLALRRIAGRRRAARHADGRSDREPDTQTAGHTDSGQPVRRTARRSDGRSGRQLATPTARQPDSRTARQPDSQTTGQPDNRSAGQTANQSDGRQPTGQTSVTNHWSDSGHTAADTQPQPAAFCLPMSG